MFQTLVFVFALAITPLGDDTVAPPKQNWFAPPVRLNAGGQPIEHGEAWGHCGPTLRDMDGDGLPDLVVGDFSGKFTIYRNVGSANAPEFGSGVLLQAGGVDAHVPVY
jgi:hypothetical protein